MDSVVFVNNQAVTGESACVSADDHGVQYGLGFFETFRTSGGQLHAWHRHRERVLSACRLARIEPPSAFLVHDEVRLQKVVRGALAQRGMTDAVFRYTVTAGKPDSDGFTYSRPGEWLSIRPLPALVESTTLRLLTLTRDNGEWVPRPKSLNFANALLGGHELRSRSSQPHEEGLFLSRDGRFVVETVRHNIAWVKDGRIHYPDLTLGPVAGTCLRWMIEIHTDAVSCRAQLGELIAADAVVVLNAVRGITPVVELWDEADQTILGRWKSEIHPMVVALRDQWRDAISATALDVR